MSNLRSVRSNIASAFEEESNKGNVINERLLGEYGKLKALNDGRGVTFYEKATEQVFLQCDGFIKKPSVVLSDAPARGGHPELL